MSAEPVPIAELLAHAEFVRGLARDLVRDPHLGDDLAQEAWLQTLRRPPQHGASLRGWLATLVTSLFANHARAERRRRLREAAAEPLPPADTAADVAAKEQVRQRLLAAVMRLDEPFRTAVLLRYHEELSPAQIARRLAIPVATVRTRVARGLERLRRQLDREHGDDRRAWVLPLCAWPGVLSAASVLVAAIGGVLVMKKPVVAAVIVLAIVLAAWISWPGLPTAMQTATSRADRSAAAVAASAADEASPPNGTAAAERSAMAARTGALRVRVTARAKVAGAEDDVVPVGGTQLAVWAGESPLVPFDGEVLRVATDGVGEAVFASLAPGPWHAQLVADQDLAPQRVVIATGAETLLPLERTALAVARGIVVDADGAPVAGADVWIFRGVYLGRYSMVERDEVATRRAAVTDAQGRFVVPLERNEGRIGASRAGYGESFAAYASDDIRLVLGRAFATVSGTVRDSQGAPVANALVRFTPAGRDTRRAADGSLLAPRVDRMTRTDADGRFRFDGVAPGRVRAWATASPRVFAAQELDVAPFATADVALQMQQGVSVIGTVRYADGTPASVLLHSRPSLDHDGHYCHCETREDGTYELYYQPRKRFVVVVSGSGGTLASREFANPEPGVLRCDFVLDGEPSQRHVPGTDRGAQTVAAPRPASVRGRFVDAGGQPVVPRAVVLRSMSENEKDRSVEVEADGTFALGDVKLVLPGVADEFRLLVDPRTAAATIVAEFTLAEAQQLDLGTLVLQPLTALDVEIVHADGSAWRVSMPEVLLEDVHGERVDRGSEPVPGGRRLQVPAGTYEVHVVGADLIAAPQQVVVAAGTAARLRVPVAIGRSRSLVCNGDGAHQPQNGDVLHVTVRSADGAIVVQRDVSDLYPDLRGFGYWYLDHVFAFGRYEVDARSDSGLCYRASFDVTESLDDPTRVDVPRVPQ
jgi:RNA polymerase sigma-70 factor (ECF subfamily)